MARNHKQSNPQTLAASTLASIEDSNLLSIIEKQYADLIYSRVRSIVKDGRLSVDGSEDCLDSVVLSLCDKHFNILRRYKGFSSFEAFLSAFCVRIADEFISSGVFDPESRPVSLYNSPELRVSGQSRKIMKKAQKALVSELSYLDNIERLALRLRFEQKMTYSEISRLLKIKNPEKILSGVFLRLRKSIEEQVEDIDSLFSGDIS
jgi:DNA-directed RNA polymerase specialized sigma24 family protein